MLNEILREKAQLLTKCGMSEEGRAFLNRHDVPEVVTDLLDEYAYSGVLRFGELTLFPLGDVQFENNDEEDRTCLEHGWLIVGSGANGDPIAMELTSRRMAFVSHEDLWGDPASPIEDWLVPTPLEFEAFWEAAFSDPDFPFDSGDAGERWLGRSPEE